MNQNKTTDSTFINQKILVSITKTTDSIHETVQSMYNLQF